MATQVSLNSGAVASAGALAIQTNGTTQAVSISTGQVATFAQNPILSSGTINGVAYINGSNALTTGSALVFDGTNLGIGETTPTQKIHLKGSATTYGLAETTGTGTSSGFRMKAGASADYTLYTTQGTNQFALYDNVASSIRFIVDSTGNVGIGASSPGAKLVSEVSGSTAQLKLTQTSYASYNFKVNTDSSLTIDKDGTTRLTLDTSGNLGVGTTSPSASAILDVQSTTKGVRMPNMTTTQKNAISSPVAGLMVFDTTLAKLCVYSGSAWQTITSI
jgi:hypothetical protein